LAIGDSFSDLNFLNTANCNGAQAKGAQFSWSRDRVAFNDQWAAKGAVAEELIWINPNPVPDGPYLNLWAIAPTVTFQRVTNSNTALAAQIKPSPREVASAIKTRNSLSFWLRHFRQRLFSVKKSTRLFQHFDAFIDSPTSLPADRP
jgi:hypothetical protein